MSGQNNNRVHTPEETSLVDSQVDLFCQSPTASPEAFSELQHDMELAFERSLREQGGPKAQERLGSTQSTPIPSSEQRIENPLAEQGPQAMVQKREGKRAVAATPAQEQAQTRDLQQEGPQAMVQKNKKVLDEDPDVKDPDVAGSAIKNEKGFSEDQLAYFAGLQSQGTAVKGKEKKRSGMSQTPFFFPETPETDPPTKEPSWSEMVEREEENLRQSDTRRGKTGGRGEGPEDSDDDDDKKDLPKKGHSDKGDPEGSGGGGGSGGFGDDFGGDGPGDGGGSGGGGDAGKGPPGSGVPLNVIMAQMLEQNQALIKMLVSQTETLSQERQEDRTRAEARARREREMEGQRKAAADARDFQKLISSSMKLTLPNVQKDKGELEILHWMDTVSTLAAKFGFSPEREMELGWFTVSKEIKEAFSQQRAYDSGARAAWSIGQVKLTVGLTSASTGEEREEGRSQRT